MERIKNEQNIDFLLQFMELSKKLFYFLLRDFFQSYFFHSNSIRNSYIYLYCLPAE